MKELLLKLKDSEVKMEPRGVVWGWLSRFQGLEYKKRRRW